VKGKNSRSTGRGPFLSSATGVLRIRRTPGRSLWSGCSRRGPTQSGRYGSGLSGFG